MAERPTKRLIVVSNRLPYVLEKDHATDRWTTKLPIRAYAMVLTPRHVVLAGTPDVVDRRDPWAALEGRAGGVLAIHARADGKQVAKTELDDAPLNDGLAAAGGRLYLTTVGGTVMCIGR